MIITQLGKQGYTQVYQAMQDFTNQRTPSTKDELWIVEFDSVFTTGIAKRHNYPQSIANIAVINTNRGGQITYHGRGQIVVYLLIDIKRLGFTVKQFVASIQHAIITYLTTHSITAHIRKNMPGVYVDNKKIASLGLKITRQGSYHGISLNTHMDLTPFDYINTCGYQDLQVCQLSDFIGKISTTQYVDIAQQLTQTLRDTLINAAPHTLQPRP